MSGNSLEPQGDPVRQMQPGGIEVLGSGANKTFGSGSSINMQSGSSQTFDSGSTLDMSGGPTILQPITVQGVSIAGGGAKPGRTYVLSAADLSISLPDCTTCPGAVIGIILSAAALSAGTGSRLTPNANDKIMGAGLTSADGKYVVIDGGTDREGDCLFVISDGVDGWYITKVIGTISRQA